MAKKYKGKQDVVNAYKRELKNFKARVKALESKGVIVDIKKKLPKPGEHVAPKDVRWLQSQTTEKIAQRSHIDVHYQVYSHGKGWARWFDKIKSITGRDVVRELRKMSVRSAREKREARSPFYRDRKTGMMVNKLTGEVLTNKEYKEYKKRMREGRTGDTPTYQDSDSFSSEYFGQWLRDLGGFMIEDDADVSDLPAYVGGTDKYARQIEEYVFKALEAYGTDGVVQALQEMSMDGYNINVKTLYDKDEFDAYWNQLITRLPVEGRYDMDMMHNDE